MSELNVSQVFFEQLFMMTERASHEYQAKVGCSEKERILKKWEILQSIWDDESVGPAERFNQQDTPSPSEAKADR